jgi:hypothetical protein
MAIRLDVNGVYQTQNGLKVLILGLVSNGYIGSMHRNKDGTNTFVPHGYYRAMFPSSGEVVFYNRHGNIISEKPGADDKPLQIVRHADH